MGAELICRGCGADVPLTGSTVTCPDCGESYPVGELGHAGTSGAPQTTLSEKDIEREALELYEAMGCTVYKTSQPRKPVGMSKGIPDLLIFRDQSKLDVPELWFHEVKPTDEPEEARAMLREEQAAFARRSEAAGVRCLVGGVGVAAAFLGLEASGGLGD